MLKGVARARRRPDRPAGPGRRLDRALDEGALLLIAPAGFGKTSALEEALVLRGGATAWVRCTEADRELGIVPARQLRGKTLTLAISARNDRGQRQAERLAGVIKLR